MVDLTKFSKLEVGVGLHDIVNIFVSRYEINLLELQKKKGEELKGLSKYKKEFIVNLEVGLNKEGRSLLEGKFAYNVPNELFKCTFKEGTITQSRGKYSFECKLELEKVGKEGSYYHSISFDQEVLIDGQSLEEIENYDKRITKCSLEISDVAFKLSQMNTKEREIRSKLSIRNLENHGLGELLEDDQLQKLIEV
jgi:hypothetical protein